MNKYFKTPKDTFVFKIYPYMNVLWKAVIYSWHGGKLSCLDTTGAWDTCDQVIDCIARDFGIIEEITQKEFNEM